MSEYATLNYQNKEYKLPIISGVVGVKALDIQQLHEDMQLYAYDPFLNNTAVTKSNITYIDSKNDKLYYRGYDIADLLEYSSFVEVAYLLIYGTLPTASEYNTFSNTLSSHAMLHEAMHNFFDGFPGNAHPLAILSTMVTALSSYYPSTYDEHIRQGTDIKARLLSKLRTLAAWAYKKSIGQPIIYPRDNLPYCANLLNMMFSMPVESYTIVNEDVRLLNQLLILYSDHEQNIATSTVHLVGSSRANLFVCINAGISALWGGREAAWEVHTMSMLNTMLQHSMSPEQFFEKFIKGEEALHSPAFGHKKYNGMEPRGLLACQLLKKHLKLNPKVAKSPIIDKALEVEEFVMGHPYFAERQLLPNLDFYSALLFHILGLPESMFNVMRTLGKLAGWLAHWEEQRTSMSQHRVMRPQQIYTGQTKLSYIPLAKRK